MTIKELEDFVIFMCTKFLLCFFSDYFNFAKSQNDKRVY